MHLFLDQFQLLGVRQALDVLVGSAACHCARETDGGVLVVRVTGHLGKPSIPSCVLGIYHIPWDSTEGGEREREIGDHGRWWDGGRWWQMAWERVWEMVGDGRG